jgi:small subunit ribosomal protein S19
MVRSLKKGPFVAYQLLKKVEQTNEEREKQIIVTWSRSSTIVPIIIGHTISIYNGREHFLMFITDQIVGHKLGEFAPTRSFRGHIKSNKKTKRLFLKILLYYGTKKLTQSEFVWESHKVLFLNGMPKTLIMHFLLEKTNISAII